jgi:hypothetical protein
LIEQYLNGVRATLQQIKAAMATNEIDAVRTGCLSPKGTGAGYGFALLSDAAKDAVRALDGSQSVAESATELQ